jgi:hypothetical protein
MGNPFPLFSGRVGRVGAEPRALPPLAGCAFIVQLNWSCCILDVELEKKWP